ncbi:hypothetical protein BOTCAL_0017g00010 [Botryotinia calthae]|uniref:LysM domain-containing protein n=1 Tax=Botryotinia calthae TaxID=38488 RepID=A0A4Y8DF40_9HELO|nr:hypothetical protein BOTCAL_0017g00010 [Botryotinia calthae]
MQYSFTALTLAILATAIHASPIQLESRDIIKIADLNAANVTMAAPPAPPSGAPAPPAPAAKANGTMPAPPSGKPAPPADAANGTMAAPPAPPYGAPAPPAPAAKANGTMPAPPAPPSGKPAPPADAANGSDLTSFSITDTPQANNTSSANSTTITTTVTDPKTNTTGTVFPGTSANCTAFFIVSMGDTCDIVDAKNGITLETLRSLNTEIDAGCTNLGVGQALCVKT